MLSFLRYIWSFVLGVKLEEYESSVSGPLELWLVNGRKVLNSAHANYSYDSLHRVFRKTFRALDLESSPPREVLVLGFGAGSVASILHKEYAFGCRITGVDLDPLLFRIAAEHFGMQPSAGLQLHTADALLFMQQEKQLYDLLLVDIFVDALVPSPVTTASFIQNCLDALLPGGRFIMNFIVSDTDSKQKFENVYTFLRTQKGELQVLHPLPGNAVLCFRKTA